MDFYILLGLERAATDSEIKRAYRRLARRHHPDINPGDRLAAARFRQIAEAYETLIDPERRRRYDLSGWTISETGEAAFGFEGFDFSAAEDGAAAPTFGDLFAEVLRPPEPGRGHGMPERGADLHETIAIGFEEAMRGGERRLSVVRHVACQTCRGAGTIQAGERPCARCQGVGVLKSARGHMVFSKTCPHCRGTGVHAQSRCPACGGQQVELRTETLTVALPAGLADAAIVRVAGKGHAGRHGGESGDLTLTVRVKPHPLFRRDGDDLHIAVPIAVHEAALGARIDVPAIEGTARLRVPPGTQSGQRFRLRERGAPSPRTGRRGDLVVEVRIVLPRMLDERSKELLREFGRINVDDVRRGAGDQGPARPAT
ncbi:MAG: J domain-containing protein [Acidobacteria bacterium]|nr:J domain-containing protein [Acidobacteriota bacterium]